MEPEAEVYGDPGAGKALSGGLNSQRGLDGPLGTGRETVLPFTR